MLIAIYFKKESEDKYQDACYSKVVLVGNNLRLIDLRDKDFKEIKQKIEGCCNILIPKSWIYLKDITLNIAIYISLKISFKEIRGG